MQDQDLAWQVEEACLDARPSPRQIMLQGWLLRASGSTSRQTNSVNPLRYGPRDPSPVMATAAAVYRRLDLPCLFRVPSLAAEMDPVLEAAGYVAEGETCALFADVDRWRLPTNLVQSDSRPGDLWLAAWSRLNAADQRAEQLYADLLGAIVQPTSFAAITVEGRIVSLAYAVLSGDLVVIEAVVTDAAFRNRGLAKQTVASLMQWGRNNGAKAACLQVVADNAPAQAVYKALGFDRELYRYHYRRAPI